MDVPGTDMVFVKVKINSVDKNALNVNSNNVPSAKLGSSFYCGAFRVNCDCSFISENEMVINKVSFSYIIL
jgi:hypothetical protein